ncbi:hypothetical protein CPB85DRAFT_1310855, partial [Mucidula mucida]
MSDHTFVGLSGGEIFHERMLRHNVKQILVILAAPFYPCSTPSTTPPLHYSARHEQGA